MNRKNRDALTIFEAEISKIYRKRGGGIDIRFLMTKFWRIISYALVNNKQMKVKLNMTVMAHIEKFAFEKKC